MKQMAFKNSTTIFLLCIFAEKNDMLAQNVYIDICTDICTDIWSNVIKIDIIFAFFT